MLQITLFQAVLSVNPIPKSVKIALIRCSHFHSDDSDELKCVYIHLYGITSESNTLIKLAGDVRLKVMHFTRHHIKNVDSGAINKWMSEGQL